jgi:hypothetical protein
MKNVTKFSCLLNTNSPATPLGLEIWLDQTQIFNSDHVKDQVEFTHEFEELDGNHELKFVMKNKTAEHTTLNRHNEIIEDAVLNISKFSFDDIELGELVPKLAVYSHDCNGTADMSDYNFYGDMGCNGTARLEFTSPIYLWILENL